MTMKRYTVRPFEAGQALRQFLQAVLSISGNQVKSLLDARAVFVNGRRIWMGKHRLAPGDIVEVTLSTERSERDSAKTAAIVPLHEDDDFLVLDKPAGLVTTGEGSFEELLTRRFPAFQPRACHRLDRDTSGCLLVAKNEAAFSAAVELFREREPEKRYLALLRGSLPPGDRDCRTPIDGRPALSRFREVRRGKEATLSEVTILTGRTHQIRIHAAELGCPVIGDKEYAIHTEVDDTIRSAPRHMLHAVHLELAHPLREGRIMADAPLPRDFSELARKLGINPTHDRPTKTRPGRQ